MLWNGLKRPMACYLSHSKRNYFLLVSRPEGDSEGAGACSGGVSQQELFKKCTLINGVIFLFEVWQPVCSVVHDT